MGPAAAARGGGEGGGFSLSAWDAQEASPSPATGAGQGPCCPHDLSDASARQDTVLPPSSLGGAKSSLGSEERPRPQL